MVTTSIEMINPKFSIPDRKSFHLTTSFPKVWQLFVINYHSRNPHQILIGSSETLPKLSHIFVELKPIQNKQINGCTVQPIHFSFVSNHHLHFGRGYEIQNSIFPHAYCSAAVKKDDPIPKPLFHKRGKRFHINFKVGQINPARIPMESQMKDAVSIHVLDDIEIELQFIYGIASQKNRSCAVSFSEKL
jgi:hypothetical protein